MLIEICDGKITLLKEKIQDTNEISLDTLIDEIGKLEIEIFSTPYSLSALKDMCSDKNYSIIVEIDIRNDKEVNINRKNIKGYLIYLNSYDTLEIMKIATQEKYRRNSVGMKLIEQLLRVANSDKKDIFLEVRESNISAINFYIKNNFQIISKRKNYYSDNNETAIIMKYTII